MAECAAAGLRPHEFWGYSPRETFALLKGAGLRAKHEQAALESNAWKSAYWTRVKKLPAWDKVMRPFLPRKRTMSRKSLRAAILGMAQAMGANVVHRPRRKPEE